MDSSKELEHNNFGGHDLCQDQDKYHGRKWSAASDSSRDSESGVFDEEELMLQAKRLFQKKAGLSRSFSLQLIPCLD